MTNKQRNVALERDIGAYIKQIRIAKGLSRESLASRIGVTHQQVQKYEKGENRITASTFVNICRALHVDAPGALGKVLGGEEEPIVRDRACLQLTRYFDKLQERMQNKILDLVREMAGAKEA